jgi:hypothetical protein
MKLDRWCIVTGTLVLLLATAPIWAGRAVITPDSVKEKIDIRVIKKSNIIVESFAYLADRKHYYTGNVAMAYL